MQRRSHALAIFAFALPFALAASAHAASDTQLTTAVKLRTGPSDSYPQVKRLAKGLDVQVHGCLQTWDWCDVEWRGARGWVPAQTVEFQREDRQLNLSRYGATLGVPVTGFSLPAYWDANYKNDPWYAERDRWAQRSARLESGGLMVENAVESTKSRAPVATTVPIAAVPVNPHLGEPLSAPVNATPPVTTTTTTTSVITTTVRPGASLFDADF